MRPKMMAAVGIFIIALGVTSALAQGPSLKAKIDFPFTVGTKMFPAGTYTFIKEDPSDAFRVTGEKTEAVAPILTRIASMMPTLDAVVFDVVGDKYILAEIWIPGDDGYVVATTKIKHEHKIVKVGM